MMPPPNVECVAEFGDMETSPALVFYRAAGEVTRYPDDIVSLLKSQGLQTGTLTGRNQPRMASGGFR